MTTETRDQRWIERQEEARDLRNQLGALGQDEESGIQFREWSPGRTLVYIWNTDTGEEAFLPRYQAVAALNLRSPRGGYLWTSHKDQAPQPRLNTIKCFLHPQSPERQMLDEIGVGAVCKSEHLASNTSKWTHARNRHPSAFAMYQEETARRENAEWKDSQRIQTEAMLALAGKVAEAPRRGRPPKDGD